MLKIAKAGQTTQTISDQMGQAVSTSTPTPNLTPELKAYWKFDEGSGNIINQAEAVGSSELNHQLLF